MQTKRSLPHTLLALAGVLAAAIPSAQAADAAGAPVSLKIAYLKGTSDLTLAKAKGSLEKALSAQNVKVVWAGPFAAAAPAFEALNADAVDLTSGSSTSFVTAVAAGIPLAIFGYQPMTAQNESILVPAKSNIRSVADLAGKVVAVNKGGTGEYLLLRALANQGTDLRSVNRRYLSPSDTGSAFVGGSVDAWATWDPFVSIAQANYDARVLADGNAIGSDNAVGYFVRKDYWANHPEVVKTVLKVLKEENLWTASNKDEAGRIWAKELNLPAELAPALGSHNVSPLRSVSKQDAATIAKVAALYAEHGLLQKAPDIGQAVIDLGK